MAEPTRGDDDVRGTYQLPSAAMWAASPDEPLRRLVGRWALRLVAFAWIGWLLLSAFTRNVRSFARSHGAGDSHLPGD